MDAVQLQPVIVEPQAGAQQLRVISDIVTFKIVGSQTNGAYSLFETQTQPQAGTPPHTQKYEHEAFYILEGTYTFLVGDAQFEARPGAFAFVPAGTVHAFTNTGSTPARMLILVTPGGIHENFFLEAGTPASEPEGPPDFAKLGAAAAKHGITILPM